jgi:Tol biopolymer transport system component
MTPNGSLVAFITSSLLVGATADRLVLWDSQAVTNVFSFAGPSLCFGAPVLSADGQRIAYLTNNASTSQVIVLDRTLGTNWTLGSYRAASTAPVQFSSDNRFLVYVASVGSATYTNQVYVYDFQNSTNLLVSHSYDGTTPGNDRSDSADLSSDGRFVAYRSAATNLVPGDTNGVPDIFLYDLLNGTTTLLSANRFGTGPGDNRSLNPVFSGDGHTLVFESWASDLIIGDYNNSSDVFAFDLRNGGGTGDLELTIVTPVSDAGCWLSWLAVPGKTYQVQFKSDLNGAVWQPLNGQVSVMGDRAYMQDTSSSRAQRFYRVVAY